MTNNSTNRAPTHRLYIVKGDDDHARWTEIGAAWVNRDGQGFTLSLDAIPTTGRVVMREITASDKEAQQ